MLYVFVSVIIYKWLLCVYVVYICISYKICIFEDFKDVWFKKISMYLCNKFGCKINYG